jgi:hypothetical protein
VSGRVSEGCGEADYVKVLDLPPVTPATKDPTSLRARKALVRVHLIEQQEAWFGANPIEAKGSSPSGVPHMLVEHL